MQPADAPLPFFVYGSLLPGQLHANLWGDAQVGDAAAVFHHGRLYDLGQYPILCEGEPGLVYGKLIHVRQQDYGALLSRLDALEGYQPHRPQKSDYWRMARPVSLADGTAVQAWVYIAPPHFRPKGGWVASGDWAAHLQQRANGKKIS